MSNIDSQIKEIKDKLLPFKDSEEYKERSTNLKKNLEKEENEQKIKEKKKFNRGKGYYQIFEWQNKIALEQAGGDNPTPGFDPNIGAI